VARLLRLPGPPKPADAADALALAICHLWRAPAIAARRAARPRAVTEAPPVTRTAGTRGGGT